MATPDPVQVDDFPPNGAEPIAVIAMAARLPGARDIEEFWTNLCAGVESIRRFSADELIALGRDPDLVRHPAFVGAEGVVDGYERFDAAFFGYAPSEAEIMDPQHRLCLEAAWTAFDTAGYDPAQVSGNVGVYLSAGLSSYLIRNLLPNQQVLDVLGGFPLLIHNDKDFLATTVSHKLGLTGPSMAVGTACSSSLVAVHLAGQSLLAGECDMALAGGVSLQVPAPQGYLYRDDGIYSPDGHCRAFGDDANGTVGGSGVGVVLLKRWRDAVRDGDHVHAVILGTAVNNDGSAKAGYTAPGVDGQTAVVAEALAVAGIAADAVGYVEAHGTGTPLGDLIEVEALTCAFQQITARRGYCAVGSVKSNIGHLDAAAGIAGFIKAVLAVERGTIPASLHCERPNEKIGFASTPFVPNARTRPWPEETAPRVAGVSSFGIGGTNAHAVLREACAPVPATSARRVQPLLLSARDETALRQGAARLSQLLRDRPGADLAGISATLAGRRVHPLRAAAVATSPRAAIAALATAAARPVGRVPAAGDAGVTLLFPGQGALHEGMVGDLERTEPAFREHVEKCLDVLDGLGVDLRDTSGLAGVTAKSPCAPIAAHPALFIVEYALARTLLDWGIRPEAVAGDGVGEYASATVAGVFTLPDALRLTVADGQVRAASPSASSALLDRFREALSSVRLREPRLAVASGLLGRWAERDELRDPNYWLRHLCDSVRLDDALGHVLRRGDGVLLEVGPSSTLTRRVRGHRDFRPGHLALATQPDGMGGESDVALVSALAQAWTAGVRVDWAAVQGGQRTRRVPVPAYPLRRKRHWIDPPPRRRAATPVSPDARAFDLAALLPRLRGMTRPEATGGHRTAVAADLDRLCSALAVDYLAHAGVTIDSGARHRVDELRDRLRILPKFIRFLDYLLGILIEDGVLRRDGDDVVVLNPTAVGSAHAVAAELVRRHPSQRGLIDLLLHCASRYPQALATPGMALATLYPDGRGDLLLRTLGESAEPDDIERAANALTDIAVRLARHRDGRPPRVLEVGAGGGRLTCRLAPVLTEHGADYQATDVGPLFVRHVADEAARRGFTIRTGVLDISREPAPQGYQPGTFDLVVGLDVVHATPDVRVSLRHLYSLLVPGGVLGLVETTARHRWLSMIWGLSDGWWAYADDLRKTTPLLDPDRWLVAVSGLGAATTAVLPGPPDAESVLVLAQAPDAAAPRDHPAAVDGLPLALPPKRSNMDDWCYIPGWRRTPAPPGPVVAGPSQSVLVFSAGPYGDAVSDRLRELGLRVAVARPCDDPGQTVHEGDRLIDPADPESYRNLLDELAADGSRPGLVAHLWNAEAGPGGPRPDAVERSQLIGLHSLLFLAQALGTRHPGDPVRLLAVTAGAQHVVGDDLTRPERVTVHAAVKVIPREYPTIACTGIDLPERDDMDRTGTLVDRVTDELLTTADSPVIAYRGGHRWLPTADAAPLPALSAPPDGVRPGGVYLLCGGLGGIGLSLAEHLAGLPATVVLTRRTPFPARERWQAWLDEHPDTDETSRIIRRLVKALAGGATVVVEQADITSLVQMQEVVSRTVARYGPITGVVHAAGVADEAGMIQRRTRQATDAAMAAKITGTLVLEQALCGQRPEFVLLCASIATVLHKLKFGEVGYLAGHDFLNAYAASRGSFGGSATIAVSWTDWLEAGMWARAQQRLADRYTVGGADQASATRPDGDLLRGITSAEGVELFRRIVGRRPAAQVVVSTQRLDQLLELHDAYTTSAHQALLDRLSAGQSGRRRPDLPTPYAGPRTATQRSVATVWQQILGTEEVGIDDDFFALGGDSLIALRLLSRLREKTEVDYPIDRFFAGPTIRVVAQGLDDAMAVRVSPGDQGYEEIVL